MRSRHREISAVAPSDLRFLRNRMRDKTAVVSFYGIRLDLCEEQFRKLKAAFRFYVSDRDEHVPAEYVNAVRNTVADAPNAEVKVYPGANTAFTTGCGKTFTIAMPPWMRVGASCLLWAGRGRDVSERIRICLHDGARTRGVRSRARKGS